MRIVFFSCLLAACGGGGAPAASSTDETPTETTPSSTTPEQSGGGETPPAVTPTYTVCDPPQPDTSCAQCQAGFTIELQAARGWRAGHYSFELVTEGNHIRCHTELPCTDDAPVSCEAAPEAGAVTVERTGCGGPAADQAIARIRFPRDACPADVRIESYRDTIPTGSDTFTPDLHRAPACGATCTSGHATLRLRR